MTLGVDLGPFGDLGRIQKSFVTQDCHYIYRINLRKNETCFDLVRKQLGLPSPILNQRYSSIIKDDSERFN